MRMGNYTRKMQAVVPAGGSIDVGDELVYVGKNGTCYVSKVDGKQLGVEVNGGVPRLIEGEFGFTEGAWTPQTAMAVAGSLARQAGLEGAVLQIEGSISTIYRVRITG